MKKNISFSFYPTGPSQKATRHCDPAPLVPPIVSLFAVLERVPLLLQFNKGRKD